MAKETDKIMVDAFEEVKKRMGESVDAIKASILRNKIVLSLVGPDATELETQHRLEARIDATLDIVNELAKAQIVILETVVAIAAGGVEVVKD